MLPAAQSDAERMCVINKLVKLLCDLKSVPFFGDLVTIVQPTLVLNIEKCEDVNVKQQLRNSIESLLTAVTDAESKTLFTQILNKL